MSPIIDDPLALGELLAAGQHGAPVALDTEADSLHRYRESLCLVQFARGADCVLIDPLAIDDLSPLGAYLEGAEVWMHGADYDMTMLQRQFNSLPPVVWDTQIAARLLGMRRFGLADLVDHYFGVKLSKSSQKADWGRRPLPPDMVAYALNDVRFLLPMAERMVAELEQRGRRGWFAESCHAARRRVVDRDDARDDPWRVRGSGKLDRPGLAFLRELWHWRDAEARSWDRPTFMVATNRDLLEWSTALAAMRPIHPPRHYRPDRLKRLEAAIERVRRLNPAAMPERPPGQRRRRNSAFDRELDALIAARDAAARDLDLDPSLIAPRSVLEQIAGGEAAPADLLLGWQCRCLESAADNSRLANSHEAGA